MSFAQSILVLGAGELGLAILQSLTAHPTKPDVSVLLRRSTSSSRQTLLDQLTSLHVNIVYGDLSAPLSDLVPLLREYDLIISATGFAAGPGVQLHIARAVLEAKVEWYIPWQFGVDYDKIGRGSSQPLFDEQLDVRDLLRGQSSTKWTIISTGIFTLFLFDPAFGVVSLDDATHEATVRALGGWDNRVTLTSVEDIGKCTAAIACDTRDKGVVYTAGSDVSFDGLADALERRGWKVQREVVTVSELEKARKDRPDDLGPRYQLIWARNIGVSWKMEETYNSRHNLDMEDIDRWIERNLSTKTAP